MLKIIWKKKQIKTRENIQNNHPYSNKKYRKNSNQLSTENCALEI